MVDLTLDSKLALVTGGSRGIGAAISRYLADFGARIAINYNQNQEEAEKVRSAINNRGGVASIFQADVSLDKDVKNLFEKVCNRMGEVAILVNNAGIWEENRITHFSNKKLDKMINVNLKSAFYCSRYAVDHFKALGEGKIINIASVAGEKGRAFHSPYAASKCGIVGLTKSLALELAVLGVRVNAVSPGIIATDMSKEALNDKEWYNETIKEIPLRRVGKPEDIAGVVAFLASDLADFITGEVICVNGGETNRRRQAH